jgi:hypothetical protein
MPAPLSIEGMSVAEKLRAMELLWDDLSKRAGMDSPGWHGDELSRREQALSDGQERTEDWEAAKCRIRDTLT